MFHSSLVPFIKPLLERRWKYLWTPEPADVAPVVLGCKDQPAAARYCRRLLRGLHDDRPAPPDPHFQQRMVQRGVLKTMQPFWRKSALAHLGLVEHERAFFAQPEQRYRVG